MVDVEDFYVVSVMTNPERFKTRPKLFKEFMARMDKWGVKLIVVEGAFGNRNFEVTEPNNPRHIQLRLESEIWHKENLINIGISRLPPNWKYVAWIDGDTNFVHPNWREEAVHELQHHPIIQMFQDAIDLGPDNEIMKTVKSFGYCYKNGIPKLNKGKYGEYWHPGYAWAATREAINTMGGLIDFAILGSADHHMACALIGDGAMSVPKDVHPNYHRMIAEWQERALRLHKSIGYIKGTIYHFWHGKKRDRKYKERWQILVDSNFDPIRHIHKDWQGVYVLYPGHDQLRDDIRRYFCERNEDSIDL